MKSSKSGIPEIPYYLSQSEMKNGLWLDNFAKELPNVKETFDIPDDLIIAISNDAKANRYSLDMSAWFLDCNNEFVRYRADLYNRHSSNPTQPLKFPELKEQPKAPTVAVPPNPFGRVVSLSQMLLASPKMSDQIRGKLGLVPSSENRIFADIKTNNRTPDLRNSPLLKIAVQPNAQVVISPVWGKKFRGLLCAVYADHTASGKFNLLDKTNQGDLVDVIVFPEGKDMMVVSYKAVYFKGATMVGEWSEPIAVAVMRPGVEG